MNEERMQKKNNYQNVVKCLPVKFHQLTNFMIVYNFYLLYSI